MIAAQNADGAICNSLEQRRNILLRAQRRIHLAVRVEILDRLIGERDVVRANLATDLHSARPRFAQKPHAPGGADVLAMDVVVAELREQNIPHHDRFLAGARPARQT